MARKGCCARTPRSSREHPYLIGAPDDSLWRARSTLNAYGLSSGEVGWFTGSGVAALIERRVLVHVP